MTNPPLDVERAMELISEAFELRQDAEYAGGNADLEEVVRLYRQVIAQFQASDVVEHQELVAEALSDVTYALVELGRRGEAIAACNESVRLFDGDNHPGLRAFIHAAIERKATIYRGSRDGFERAVEAYYELIERFGDADGDFPDGSPVRAVVSEAHKEKGFVLWKLGRPHDALAALDEVEPPQILTAAWRFGCYEPKGAILRELERREEALMVYDQFMRRYAEPVGSSEYSWIGMPLGEQRPRGARFPEGGQDPYLDEAMLQRAVALHELAGRGLERLVEIEGLGALPPVSGIDGTQEVAQLIFAEPGQVEINRTLELGEQVGQELLVPLAGDPVEGQAQEPALLGTDVEPDDRHRLEPEPSSRHEALMTTDDRGVVTTRQDGLNKPPSLMLRSRASSSSLLMRRGFAGSGRSCSSEIRSMLGMGSAVIGPPGIDASRQSLSPTTRVGESP